MFLMSFRYEKQHSNFVSCLERSESASKPESPFLSAGTKLRGEIQDLQVQFIQTQFNYETEFN